MVRETRSSVRGEVDLTPSGRQKNKRGIKKTKSIKMAKNGEITPESLRPRRWRERKRNP
jgi:hypothetical protein